MHPRVVTPVEAREMMHHAWDGEPISTHAVQCSAGDSDQATLSFLVPERAQMP